MDEQAPGATIRIFLAEGTPTGLRTIEKSNWTGKGLLFPRASYARVKSRSELTRAGVYVLYGLDAATGQLRVYVGEGDPVRPRLDTHGSRKDFWTHALVFVSKDDNLNKAHIQYLESRLLAILDETRRADIDNQNRPERPSLSEPDQAEAEGFLQEMLVCLPVLGLSVFEHARERPERRDVLSLRGKGIEAHGFETVDGFVVLQGAGCAVDEVASIPRYLADLRRSLRGRGVLAEDGGSLRFTQDFTFDSPSAAAGVILGGSVNGREAWKDAAGRTLKEFQQAADEPLDA